MHKTWLPSRRFSFQAYSRDFLLVHGPFCGWLMFEGLSECAQPVTLGTLPPEKVLNRLVSRGTSWEHNFQHGIDSDAPPQHKRDDDQLEQDFVRTYLTEVCL